MAKVYCEECYYYDYEVYFGTDCTHPANVRVHVGDTWRKKDYGYLWHCYKKNGDNDCALYLDDKAERDRKCIFKWWARKFKSWRK